MCAWMPELWLEKNGIEEQDVPWLTFVDTDDEECQARDIGALEGMPEDAHYWLWQGSKSRLIFRSRAE